MEALRAGPLTISGQIIWAVLRVFIEELVLLQPECKIDLGNTTLTDVLHTSSPIHEVVVVLPRWLPWPMHVGETVSESSIARPRGVGVGT
jgi:hypothetical protein